MDTYQNKIKNLDNYIMNNIDKVNKDYERHFFKVNNNLYLSKYTLTSLDDNSYINNYTINRYSLIKDDTIDNLLNTMTCVYNIFDDNKWLKYTDDCFITNIKDNKIMFVNSIMENNINSNEFNNFIRLLQKYKDKFNLEVDKLFNDEEDDDSKDDEYKINLSWIIIYVK